MHPQPPLGPPELHYDSARPLRTLFGMLNRSRRYYLATALVMVIKHSPVWAIPFLVARAINSLTDPAAFPASRLAFYFGAVVVLIVQNVPMHTLYV